GNLLISAQNASLVAKIHRTTGKVLWILGGKLNQFTFDNTAAPSEPAEFSYQHDVRRIANGNITLFDNGNLRSPQWSRAAEYQIDETKKTCRLVWRYRPVTDLFSVSQGSCQTLTNGNKLISWGSAVSNNRTLITEVTTTGETVFEAELPNSMIPYKVERAQAPIGRDAADVLIDEILPTNTYTYTRGKDTVGVSITYHTLISFFYNTTTAQRFMWSPENPRFVRSKEKDTPFAIPPRTIYKSRMTITQEGMEKHGAEFRFKADLFGVTDPANTVVYYRPIIGSGKFYPLRTRYNPNTRELVVDTSEVGEFCFGSPIEDPSSIASEEVNDIHFAPNPTSDHLFIGGTQELSRISVFNTSGAMVATFAIAGTGISIDTSTLPQGSYMVVLQGPRFSETKQLQIIR
ncbi:MAG: aryl-sulfate sulfotransferase, partial [Candidatus Kapaibacterium sp.]